MRIAVLLTGRLLFFKDHYANIVKTFGPNIDFFLSTDPSLDENIEEFIKLYKPIAVNNKPITEVNIYKPFYDKFFTMFPKALVYRNSDNMTKNFINKRRVVQLLKTHIQATGTIYDYICMTRLDIFYNNSIDWSYINPLENTIFVPEGHDYNGLNDRLCIGNLDTIEKYANIYNNSLNIIESTFETNNNVIFPEILLHAHITDLKVNVKRFPLKNDIVRLTQVEPKYDLIMNKRVYNKNTMYTSLANSIILKVNTNEDIISFNKIINKKIWFSWFGYELEPGSYTLTFDIISNRDIDYPFIKFYKSNDYFPTKKINADCFEPISLDITVDPSDTKILFIFDELEDYIDIIFHKICFTKTPLCRIMKHHGSDKGGNVLNSWHNYTVFYNSIFNNMRLDSLRLFELGIGSINPQMNNNMGVNGKPGASLYGWSEFFPNAKCFGADIDKDILFNTEKINTFYCDQTDSESITNMWSHKLLDDDFDIIIDDGYHTFLANVCFFENSIHKLKDNGYYIIEDIKNYEKSLFIPKIEEWKKAYPQLEINLLSIPSRINKVDNNLLVFHKKKISTIHIVLFANGEPFETVKKTMAETVKNCSKNKVKIHEYNLDIIKTREWFKQIEGLPNIHKTGRRDGYYCAYKIFCVNEVYKQLEKNDVLFYLDCSQYYKDGFTESIDRLCSIALEKGIIAGSFSRDLKHDQFSLCNNFNVWKTVLPNCDKDILQKPHVLAAWFLLSKNNTNTQFMNDWIKWSMYTDEEFKEPLVTQHLTGDQSIFNMLVYKYKLPSYFNENSSHLQNRDKNRVLNSINNAPNPYELFTIIN